MLEIETYLKLLWRWLWFLVLGAAAGAAATFLALSYLGLYPSYQTTATVTVGAQLEATTVSETELSIGQDLVPNYVVLATRPPITDAVIENLNLDISTDQLVTYKLEVVQEGQTRVVLITGKDPNPETAAAIANETARQLRASGPLRPTELIQIVALAKVPKEPSTEPYLIMALGGLVGGLAFALIAVLVELKQDRPKTLSWAAARINLPLLGAFRSRPVPVSTNSRRWGRKAKTPADWERPAPVWWAVMETFERAVAQDGAAPKGPGRVVAVTSPDRSRSKAVAALELARAWATTGEKVILVDADPDHPTLDRWFNLANESGVTHLLSLNSLTPGEQPIDGLLANSQIENLYVLTSGPRPAQASALLYRRPWQEMVSTLSQQADVVIVISPPLGSGPEAIIPSAHANAVLLVLDLGKTGAAETNQFSDLLTRSGSQVLGAVVRR